MSHKANCGDPAQPSPKDRQVAHDACPDSLTLAGYLDDMLGPEETRAFERHLETCAACRAAVDELREMLGELSGPTADASSLKAATDRAKKLVGK